MLKSLRGKEDIMIRPPAILASAIAITAIGTIGVNLYTQDQAAQNASNAAGGSTSPSNASGATGGSTTTPSTPAGSTTTSGVADGIFQGDLVNTRYGTVQVSAVMSNGKITDVIANKLTDADRKSTQISNQAAPILKDEVLKAQSAKVSNVSGATYTSHAYLQSLQHALDAAGFKG